MKSRSYMIAGTIALALAGCGTRDSLPNRFGDMPDWQLRNIAGQNEHDITSPQPSDPPNGPMNVKQGPSGRSAVYPGGGSIADPHPGITYATTGNITINFNDVDAKEAAKTILDDVLNTTFVIDPKVEGRVTIKSARAVAPREALRLLDAGLRTTNATLTIRNNVHYVHPRGQTPAETAGSIVPAQRGGSAGMSSRAIQLRFIAATEMAEILKPMVKEGGMVRVDGARNLLVLAGTGADHEAWLETIRTFDVDWLANKSVAVFRIGNMPAETMVRSLTEILRNENVNEQMVRFMALDSGNAVLAVARTPQILEATRGWVRRIEIAGGQQLQLFSYQMRYAQASQALPILSKIFGVQGASEAELSSLGVAARLPAGGARGSTARPASGMPVGTGGFGASSPPSSLAQTTMAPGGNGAGAGAQPTSMTGARTQAFSGFGNGNGNGGGDGHMPTSMRLIANEPTNTLLIYATDEDYKKVRNVLRTVDVPPRQVLVEATIVEVALTDELRYGVQYYLNGRLKGTPIDVALTNGDFRGIGPEAPGFGMALGAPAKVVIDALTTMTQVTVVSAPTVMVLNNQSARLVVGDQVPIATQNRTDPLQPNLVTVNTIELRDTGVIFEVTPRINSSGSVLLDINQEVSSVQRQADPTLTPTISQRKLASSVTVEHGETIVLGGLFSNQKETGRTGLPGLSQLPLVGGAFGRTTTGGGRTELIVLITPKIVNNKYETRAATNEMRRRIQELRFEDANVHEKPIAPPPVVVETPVPATPVDVKPLDPPCADPCAAPHGRSAHWPTTSSIDRPQAAPTPATEPQPVLRGSRASRNGG